MAIQTALNKIEREIGIKRCLIINGNVNDVFLDNNSRLCTLKEYLKKLLSKRNYDTVSWDITNNIEGDMSTLLVNRPPQPEGEVYDLDLGDGDNGLVSDNNSIDSSDIKNVNDMFEVIMANMTGNSARKYAFILDWGDFMFSNSPLSDETERTCLTKLSKAINDLNSANMADNKNVIIIITRNLALFPVSFYNRNPDVSCISMTVPDREERQRLYDKEQHRFKVVSEHDVTRLKARVDMLEGFTNKEILQMARLSETQDGNMSFDKLFFLFKYGEKENPWEKLDYHAVKGIKEQLRKRVIGQDEAIEKAEKVVVKAYMGLSGIHKSSSRNAPKGVLFFVGPTGVGKTELSKALAEFLFGDEQACIRFDMSEYAQDNSDQKLIGAPPGFVGFEEGGQLTNAVREKPFSIILFDEIEKAAKPNPRILDIFLQILEDGRLTDSRGETVYFSESVIIFTSNLGAATVRPEGTKEQIAQNFIDEVKQYFNNEIGRPELLGRIGMNNIVPFNFINDTSFTRKIARSKLQPIKSKIREKFNLNLEFDDEEMFIEYILGGADSNKGGRDILNALNDRLLDELAMFLFDNKEDLYDLRDSSIRVRVDDSKINFSWA